MSELYEITVVETKAESGKRRKRYLERYAVVARTHSDAVRRLRRFTREDGEVLDVVCQEHNVASYGGVRSLESADIECLRKGFELKGTCGELLWALGEKPAHLKGSV